MVREVLGVRICTNRKPTHDFLLNLNVFALSAAVWPKFQCQIIPPPQFHLTVWVVENGPNRNVEPTFLFDYYTHYMPIFHRLATKHNAADDRQQTDRAIGTGIWYSIGGLKYGNMQPTGQLVVYLVASYNCD